MTQLSYSTAAWNPESRDVLRENTGEANDAIPPPVELILRVESDVTRRLCGDAGAFRLRR
jgi:hypothetical protein